LARSSGRALKLAPAPSGYPKVDPKRSTLSYANAHRPWQLYQQTFYDLLQTCRCVAPGKKRKFRFRNKPQLSLDATVIDLCLNMFPWAEFRQTKGAVKLHMLLDHDGYLPTYVHITEGKAHEVKIARMLRLSPGSIVAMDRAYNDYSLYHDWTRAGVYVVTRQKRDAAYEVIENRPLPENRVITLSQSQRGVTHFSEENVSLSLR